MTSELIKALIDATPLDFHTVAAVCGEFDGASSLPYISPKDVTDGNARVLGANQNLNLANGGLPAMLLYETTVSTGVLACIWHRDYGQVGENAGVRMSVTERDEVKAKFYGVISKLKAARLNFKLTTQLSLSYENAYDALMITTTYKWEPSNCIGGLPVSDEPTFFPGIYKY